LRDWLEGEGWKDEIFLDHDSKWGIAAGERWERCWPTSPIPFYQLQLWADDGARAVGANDDAAAGARCVARAAEAPLLPVTTNPESQIYRPLMI